MKVGIVTQARMTSSRLPGKVLCKAGGRTMLDHHLDRLTAIGQPIYIATTTNGSDDPIVDLAQERGVGTFRGSENDVLARFMGCALTFGLDAVVRVTSDCPLIDGKFVMQGIQEFLDADNPWLYISNTITRTFPRGMDFEVFSTEALQDAYDHASEAYQREHVTPYLYERNNSRMTLINVPYRTNRSFYRLTLDTSEDLALLTTLIEDYRAETLNLDSIVTILDANPALTAINRAVEQKKLNE